MLKTFGVSHFNLFCLINRKLFKHDIVYLVCLWTSPATKSDFSETNASFIFMGTGEQLPHSCLILVAEDKAFITSIMKLIFIVSINSEIQNKFMHLTKLWFRVGVITVSFQEAFYEDSSPAHVCYTLYRKKGHFLHIQKIYSMTELQLVSF